MKSQDQRIRYFSELSLKDGESTSKVQILKTGRWNHPQYGDFSISSSDLDMFVQNFNDKVRGTDLCVDVNHDWNHEAVGWFRQVERVGEALFATIEWNAKGRDLINSKTYRYFSPELFFTYRDEESGRDYRCVLIGGGITNRPFFKGMEALKASESGPRAGEGGSLYFNDPKTMPKFKELADGLSKAAKVETVALDQLRAAFNELPDSEKEAAKADLDAAEKRFNDEAQAAQAEADKAKADAAKAEADKAALAASESIESAVFKEFGMKMEDIKAMQKQFSEMEKKQKLIDTEKKVDAFVFSESNKDGALLPKAKDRVTQFAAKLPDAMAAEFFEIMASKPFRAFAAGEIGKAGDAKDASAASAAQFNIPEKAPEGVTRESFVLEIVSKKFAAEDKTDYGTAMVKAAKFIRENGIK